jgi:metal-dependent HD superfamily phosphatase/phosphodiesterase
MITFEEIKHNEAINTYIRKADESLIALGYTEHSFAHVGTVANNGKYILETLGYPERLTELVQIAAWLHDIGNLVNRTDHSQSGAVMVFRILDNLGMSAEEISEIVTSIGNHDEGTGRPVSVMSAALILADKSDVRRSRVRNSDETAFDIHDRVNYSVRRSELKISDDKKIITLTLDIDTRYCSVMDYFEIFMQRMLLCRKAAQTLGMHFSLVINGQTLV